MRKEGLAVDRPVVPISLQLSEDPKELADPHAFPIKVRSFSGENFFSVSFRKGTHFHPLTGRTEAPR